MVQESRAQILLVEDNRINQMVALQILERAGYSADSVANAQEAIERLKRQRYGLVLMDVQMPGMDGISATRVVRDPNSGVLDHAVPIIAMTAYDAAEDRRACREAGMNAFLTKPLEVNSFLKLVQRHLKQT
ncbi:MAG: response regulator [Spirochaetaceae bacterium]|nr:MAG: response regulator [Spirochaetaceae bacterium]